MRLFGGVFSSYKRLLSRPHGARLLLAAAGARIPQGMVGLALLLMVAHYYGVASGGGAVACYSVGMGLLGPIRGRLVDRRGIRPTLGVMVAIYFPAVVLVTVLCGLRTDLAFVLMASTAVGLSAPPLGSAVRAIWASMPDADERRAGLAVDASFVDVSFIVGPLAVSGLQYLWVGAGMLSVLPVTAMGAACLISVSATTGTVGGKHNAQRSSSTWARVREEYGAFAKPLRTSGFRRLMVLVILVYGALSSTMVGLPSVAKLAGASWATGLLVAAVSAGSVIGVLIWGRQDASATPSNELSRLTAAFAVTLVFLPLVGSHVWLLILVAPLVGLPIASTLATVASRAQELSPVGGTETQSWVGTFNQVGSSASAAVVTSVAQFSNVRIALAIPACLAGLATVVSLL